MDRALIVTALLVVIAAAWIGWAVTKDPLGYTHLSDERRQELAAELQRHRKRKRDKRDGRT